MKTNYTLDTVDNVAKQIIENAKSKTLLFYGSMGVGKTTLIKSIAKLLGSDDDISSPTFSIVNEYESSNGTIYHFDLYRIKDIEETYNFGIEDYLDSGHWILIEWPELIEELITEGFDKVDLSINTDNTRTLELKNNINLKQHISK